MKVFGLLGRTLSHSFSKKWFEEKFAREQLSDFVYNNFELSHISHLPELLQRETDLQGFNITIPYKQDIVAYLHRCSDVVRMLGACNCVRVEEDLTLSGFNTDVIGFREALYRQLDAKPEAALILGTGGASKAVQFVLDEMGISWKLVSRSAASGLSYEELTGDLLQTYQLVINTTPVGTFPNIDEKPFLPYEHLTPEHFLFDLVYNPTTTAFMNEGIKKGARVSNGYEMLVLQAEASWRIWNHEEEQELFPLVN